MCLSHKTIVLKVPFSIQKCPRYQSIVSIHVIGPFISSSTRKMCQFFHSLPFLTVIRVGHACLVVVQLINVCEFWWCVSTGTYCTSSTGATWYWYYPGKKRTANIEHGSLRRDGTNRDPMTSSSERFFLVPAIRCNLLARLAWNHVNRRQNGFVEHHC